MIPGADTDIVTGKPKEKVAIDATAEKQIRDENILKNQADFLGLSKSPDGQKLIALVQEQLNKRIEALIATDAAATAYVQILSEMGLKEAMAKKAAARLVEMKTGKE